MGLPHVIRLERRTGFMSFDWFRHVAQLTQKSQLMDLAL